MSELDYPANFAETTAVLGVALCNHWLDPRLRMAMRFGVVATVGVDDFGHLKRSATYASNRRNGIDKRQLGDVVAVELYSIDRR